MKLLDEVAAWVKKVITGAGADVEKGEQELLNVATIGSNILEAAKGFAQSPEGKILIDIIEAIPGVGPIATDVVNVILPKAVSALSTVEANATDPEAIVISGLKAVGANTEADEVATIYTGISALITNKIAPLLNVISTIQTALSVTPAVYVAPKEATT